MKEKKTKRAKAKMAGIKERYGENEMGKGRRVCKKGTGYTSKRKKSILLQVNGLGSQKKTFSLRANED